MSLTPLTSAAPSERRSRRPATSEEGASRQNKACILIIDDQPSARAWARGALEGEFRCFETGSVQEFFELALRERPDVILADLEMQPLSGIKLCRMVKANPALASVPFVLLTGHETAEDKIASLADGADDHLPKSISARELLGRIRATVRLRSALLRAANLEGLVDQRTLELRATTEQLRSEITRREQMEAGLRLAQKLEAVGQLAAGVAHEINTPMQYIGDSLYFLKDSFTEVLAAVGELQSALGNVEGGANQAEIAGELQRINETFDLEYVKAQVPQAFAMTLEGVARVSSIVAAMKALVHPGQSEKAAADVHAALKNALIVTRSAYRDVADVETDFGDLPLIDCQIGELNQVFVNLIVNAAHAISDVVARDGGRGKIRVRTRLEGEKAVISVADTGAGIPESIRHRIFDPFFTTKPVGRGTGQGLGIASAIVENHGGRLTLETEVGRGTTFTITLPISHSHAEATVESAGATRA